MLPNRPTLDVISHSPEQTRRIGALLGRSLDRGSLVLLGGMIGAGKTTFTQGIAHGLQVETPVTSPTFTIVSEHSGRDRSGKPLAVYHIDLYRLEEGGDLLTVGLEEYLDDPDAVIIIEWPERAGDQLPEEHLLVELSNVADSKRSIAFTPRHRRYLPMIDAMRREMAGARG
jgi:tRNA threonylcarbamoyladenosine biosynthesis protein TsaE